VLELETAVQRWGFPQATYALSGKRSANLARVATQSATQARGGIPREVSIEVRYGTGTRKSTAGELARVAALAETRVTHSILPVIRDIASDQPTMRVLQLFFEDGGQIEVARGFRGWGQYRPGPPPRLIVHESVLAEESMKTQVSRVLRHELLHYALDREDALISEAHTRAGMDHPLVYSVEDRADLLSALGLESIRFCSSRLRRRPLRRI
jgi:hypothetical protein